VLTARAARGARGGGEIVGRGKGTHASTARLKARDCEKGTRMRVCPSRASRALGSRFSVTVSGLTQTVAAAARAPMIGKPAAATVTGPPRAGGGASESRP
jgi:hypothetical protein